MDVLGKIKKFAQMVDEASPRILAHIAGPSGSGKTTLLNEIQQEYPNARALDFDWVRDEAARKMQLNPTSNKGKWSEAKASTYLQLGQQVLDAELKKFNGPTILGGYHTEFDAPLKFEANKRFLLDTSPFVSALRRYHRGAKRRGDYLTGLLKIPRDYKHNKEDIAGLKRDGYSLASPDQIKKYVAQQMKKQADMVDELKPYQRRVVDRIQSPNQPGLVVAHSVGTGKTLSSIAAYKALGLPTNVIVPAALKANYNKELTRWLGAQPADLNIVSQQALARAGMGSYDKPNGLMIVDESHRARESSSKLLKALQQSRAKKKLLLTGTPIFNHPKDLATLVNLAANKQVLPEDTSQFEQKYIGYKKVNPGIFQRLAGVRPGQIPFVQNKGELSHILRKYVDYQAGVAEGYPSSKEEVVKVPMGSNQTDVYKSILGKAPAWVRWKVKMGLPPDKKELTSLQAFLSGPRQVSNTNRSFILNPNREEATKVEHAFKYLKQQIAKNPKYKAVVYSNYLNSGLAPYKKLLDRSGIPYGEFSGDIDQTKRNEIVKQYNEDKLRALLISSAGAEGLDLKKTSLIQLLEPHFNRAKEEQIIGRGIRYKSHDGLPPEQQKVLIQRYLAQPRAGFLDRFLGKDTVRGTDEYIYDMAARKELLKNEVINILSRK